MTNIFDIICREVEDVFMKNMALVQTLKEENYDMVIFESLTY